MKEIGLLIALGIGIYLLAKQRQAATAQASIQAKIAAARAGGYLIPDTGTKTQPYLNIFEIAGSKYKL